MITAFSVGGFDSMQHDIEIPQRYGIRQPIGDSVGPGGVLRALRSIPVLLDIARDVEAVAPDAWLVNVTNPLTALCRSVTSQTGVKTVGLCNEWVGCTWMLSLLLDCGMHEIDPVLGGVNHYPLATSLRVGADDGFARLRAVLDDPDAAADANRSGWTRPNARVGSKVSPSPFWSKLDVIANNRVRLELFQRFGVLPGSGDHHAVEFMPGFVHPQNDYGSDWRVHHYGMPGHRRDADDDVAYYEEMRDASDVTRMPSGELVANLLDGMVTGKARALPVNLPNRGNVTNLADDAVVEIIGVADGARRARSRHHHGARDPRRVPAAHQRRAGVDGRGRAQRRPRARARSDARRSDGATAAVRADRDDDRRDARGDGPLAPAVRPLGSPHGSPDRDRGWR